MLRKILKWVAILIALVFVGIQFIRPDRTNAAVDETRTLQARTRVTPEVETILARSCNDCHSERTRYPWYSQIAPASWFLDGHIREGRREMNFSDWASYDEEEADILLQKICGEVKHGAMPLPSYLIIHRDAKLTPRDVQTLCDWSSAERQRLGSK